MVWPGLCSKLWCTSNISQWCRKAVTASQRPKLVDRRNMGLCLLLEDRSAKLYTAQRVSATHLTHRETFCGCRVVPEHPSPYLAFPTAADGQQWKCLPTFSCSGLQHCSPAVWLRHKLFSAAVKLFSHFEMYLWSSSPAEPTHHFSGAQQQQQQSALETLTSSCFAKLSQRFVCHSSSFPERTIQRTPSL